MARVPRHAQDGAFYHTMNRAQDKRRIFNDASDYAAFVMLLGEAQAHAPVRLLAYCIMPNHWHLVLWPTERSALPAYMHWLTNAHVRRFLRQAGRVGLGHVYQGRYKSVPVSDESHLLIVLRYVEANPVRAGLVTHAAAWPWSSASDHCSVRPPMAAWPIPRPAGWLDLLDRRMPAPMLETVRRAVDGSVSLERAAAAGESASEGTGTA